MHKRELFDRVIADSGSMESYLNSIRSCADARVWCTSYTAMPGYRSDGGSLGLF